MQKIVVLDNIRSAHNVGAIFRTCDGAGVSKIYLCGYTPRPIDRFGREQPEILKTSLGATKTVEWEGCERVEDALTGLRGDGVAIAAIEQTDQSVSYKDWQLPSEQPTAFIFGNEVDGVQPTAIEKSDVVIEIPMLGTKESLNVSNSTAVILFHFT